MVDFSYTKNRVKQINLTQLYLLLHKYSNFILHNCNR